jgi:hypothetical protein
MALRQVFVVQDTRSGNFLSDTCDYVQSLSQAGRLFDPGEAKDTAICQLGYEYEIHSFYEDDGDAE